MWRGTAMDSPLWWKEVGKMPGDTSWVTEAGGQQQQAPRDISAVCVRADLCLGW